MFGKTLAALAMTASLGFIGVPPAFSSQGSSTLPAVSPTGWYTTNSNPAGSRANRSETVLSPSAVAKVKYLRSIASPFITSSACFAINNVAAPLPFDGYLYVLTDYTLSKYNPAKGTLIWRKPLSTDYDYNALAISGGRVLASGISCESASTPNGIVYAFNESTGVRDWVTVPNDAPVNDVVAYGSYVVTEGVNAEGSEVTALSLTSGKTVWATYGCGGVEPALVVHLLVISSGCSPSGTENIQAQNLTTGSVVWTGPSGWVPQRGDLADNAGNYLYVTDSSGTVLALDPLTGLEKYSLSGAVTVLAVNSPSVYATCGTQGEFICSYNMSTGQLQWENTGLPPLSYNTALGAEADGVLYLDSGLALNAATGKLIREIWVGTTATALAIGNGRIAVATDPRVLDLFGLPGY